ncbi:hypothetical protein QBC34DRAFT_384560 [Podospora aff. communis PSN243]|uniref:Uncharacterized protein n=1 Tax=Podospora aff. communis PSN243 TaxID=3040156 RepID=A0AAV9GCR2_9PEZI|nr:hypothetical protein QBC34DRAFT_384560 [Podospora aff. communis PSN243]
MLGIPVDYSKPPSEVALDVISAILLATSRNRVPVFDELSVSRVVRLTRLVAAIFEPTKPRLPLTIAEGDMQAEATAELSVVRLHSHNGLTPITTAIMVLGLEVGDIGYLGPSIDDLISSPDVEQEWRDAVLSGVSYPLSRETLNQENDCVLRSIREMSDEELCTLCIGPSSKLTVQTVRRFGGGYSSRYTDDFYDYKASNPSLRPASPSESRLCRVEGGYGLSNIGIVPLSVQPGDRIVHIPCFPCSLILRKTFMTRAYKDRVVEWADKCLWGRVPYVEGIWLTQVVGTIALQTRSRMPSRRSSTRVMVGMDIRDLYTILGF